MLSKIWDAGTLTDMAGPGAVKNKIIVQKLLGGGLNKTMKYNFIKTELWKQE